MGDNGSGAIGPAIQTSELVAVSTDYELLTLKELYIKIPELDSVIDGLEQDFYLKFNIVDTYNKSTWTEEAVLYYEQNIKYKIRERNTATGIFGKKLDGRVLIVDEKYCCVPISAIEFRTYEIAKDE